MKRIETPHGVICYNPQIVYEGIKIIDKQKAKQNLLLFKKIADKNKLEFGLSFGTFLGAIRDNDFIEHDEDTDLFVLDEEKDKFLSMLTELCENGFEIIRYDRRGDLCSIMRNGEYIDILFFRHVCQNVRQAQSYFIPETFLIDLSEYEFQGNIFKGPRTGVGYLTYWYGENWHIPIQRDNYNLPYWKRVAAKIKWKVYEIMPKFLFSFIIRKRLRERIIQYNEKVERYYRLTSCKCNDISEIKTSDMVKILEKYR